MRCLADCSRSIVPCSCPCEWQHTQPECVFKRTQLICFCISAAKDERLLERLRINLELTLRERLAVLKAKGGETIDWMNGVVQALWCAGLSVRPCH